MSRQPSTRQLVRFGVFELDVSAGELRRRGRKINLQQQPFQVLALLLRRPGEVVTREELQQELWPADTFVEFDQGLNTAIKKIRRALADSATFPRFIETRPRQGYRFIAPVQEVAAPVQEVVAPAVSIPAQTSRRLGLVWLAATFAVAVLGVTVWLLVAGRTPPAAELVPVPLTTYTGNVDSPSFSPDGKQLAFYWDGPQPGAEGVYVKVIGEDPPVLVAQTPHGYPAWSPDGSHIAFLGDVPSGNCGVFLVPAVGGPARKVAEIPLLEMPTSAAHYGGSCPAVSWHPNGKWLVVVDRITSTESCALSLISLDGGEKRTLTSPSGTWCDHSPAVSPDGRAVAFLRYQGMSYVGFPEILELADDLSPIGEPRPLTSSSAYIQNLAWAPDGHSVVFSAGPFHTPSLFRLYLLPGWRPGRIERLGFAGEGAFSPATSRQGRLAFLRLPLADADIWRLELSGGRWTGKAPVRLISSTRLDHEPAYSPDGKRIAFASARSGSFEIWVCDAEGRNAVQFTWLAGPLDSPNTGLPTWSPDGRWIYFESNWIYAISSEGGRPKKLSYHGQYASVSRDGRWLYFASNGSAADPTFDQFARKFQLWKMPVDGGDAIQVTRNGAERGFESPDGKSLYYLNSTKEDFWWGRSLWRIQGHEETHLIKDAVFCDNVAVGDAGVYFISARCKDGNWNSFLNLFNFSTNQVEQITKLEHLAMCGFSLSPDGRYLLYTLMEQPIPAGTGLMLVEDFR